jgi:zinc protease
MRFPTFLAHGALAGVLACAFVAPASAALPIQKWQQPSGAQVWLIESPSLPMVDVEIDFDAGDRRDPADKAGLAGITADMTSKGILARDGEPALDENQLGEAWADLGASFGGGASLDRMSFSLRSLTYPDLLDKAVKLAARELGEPSFPDAIWQRDRQRMIASIREANTRPGTIAARAFGTAVYGGHPYGYDTTEETVNHISVQDMRNFYSAILPCRAKVSIVGAVTRPQADQIATTLLSRLPAGRCEPLPAVPEVPALSAAAERDIPFNSAQTHVLIGQPGYKRSDPDYFPLLVGNYILGGGGFASRLMQAVRERRGLAYGIVAGLDLMFHRGVLVGSTATENARMAETLAVTREEWRRMAESGPTEEELKDAVAYLTGALPLQFADSRRIADGLLTLRQNDRPPEWLAERPARLRALRREQLARVAARLLRPEDLSVVIAGQPAL